MSGSIPIDNIIIYKTKDLFKKYEDVEEWNGEKCLVLDKIINPMKNGYCDTMGKWGIEYRPCNYKFETTSNKSTVKFDSENTVPNKIYKKLCKLYPKEPFEFRAQINKITNNKLVYYYKKWKNNNGELVEVGWFNSDTNKKCKTPYSNLYF